MARHLTRRQKKLLKKKQLLLEKRLVAAGKIPPRHRYEPRGFFWRVLAVSLAFIFGIIAAIGGLIGGFLYAGLKVSVQEILGLIGVNTAHILNEEYANMSALDFARSVIGDVNNLPFDSLDAIAKYTPVIDEHLKPLLEQLEGLGVYIDSSELKSVKFTQLKSYFQDNVIDQIVLGETLGLTPNSDTLIVAICYGSEGEDYTIVDGKFVMNEGKYPLTVGQLKTDKDAVFERILVEDALSVTAESNAAMRFLAYGTEGTHYEIEDGKIVMLINPYTGLPFEKKRLSDLTTDGNTPLEDARISDLMDVGNASGILATIKDWRLSDLKNGYRIQRLKISLVLNVGEDASPLVKAISGWRIGDLADSSKVNSLTLGDLLELDENSPKLLRSLADAQLGEFGNRVDMLRLSDILDADDLAGNRMLKNLGNSTLATLSDDLQKLTVEEVFGDLVYSYRKMDSDTDTWLNFVKGYDPLSTDEQARVRPQPYAFAEGESAQGYRLHGSTELTDGWFTADKTLAQEIYRHTDDESSAPRHFTQIREDVEAVYDWKRVDYALETLVELGADSVGTEADAQAGGYILPVELPNNPYLEDGEQIYYLTTGYLPGTEDQDELKRIAYALREDDFGIYYTYMTYTPDGGASTYNQERADLERLIVGYLYGDTLLTVQGDEVTDEDGNVYRVYTEGDTYYVKAEYDVAYYWYDASEQDPTLYEESETTEKFRLVDAENDPVLENGNPVMLDRYIWGAWMFLFGDEVYDEATGELLEIQSKLDSPVLEINTAIDSISSQLSRMDLWKLYLYGLIDRDPYVNVAVLFPEGVEVNVGKTVTNLNQCNITECITLMQAIMDKIS